MEGKGGVSMGVKVRERKGMYRYLAVGLLIILFHISLAIPTIAEQLKDADAAYLRGIPRLCQGAMRTPLHSDHRR